MKATLSVLMSAYNAESTISESIKSVLDQTFKDFELIVCEDGSNDNTYKILEEYSKRDERVIILKNEKNEGIPSSLNRCFKIASGRYIARQDADDLSNPNRFKLQIDFLEKNLNYALVGTGCQLFDESYVWGRIVKKTTPSNLDFIWDIPHVNATIVYRKETIDSVRGYHESKLTQKRSEDYDMLCRLYASGARGYNIPEVLYYYRIGKNDYKRRRYGYRFYETITRIKGFGRLKLPFWAYLFVFKPLIVGLIPKRFMFFLHKKRFGIK